MEDSRHLRHPLLPPSAKEFALRWEIARMIQRARHNVAKVFHCRLTNLQDTTSTRPTELSVQHSAAAIVGFVYSGFLRVRGIGERGDRDFGCKAKRCAEEFLQRVLSYCERGFAAGDVPCNSCSDIGTYEHRQVKCQRLAHSGVSVSPSRHS